MFFSSLLNFSPYAFFLLLFHLFCTKSHTIPLLLCQNKLYFSLLNRIESGVKRSAYSFMVSNCTKKYCKFHCANIPISLRKHKACSAEASTLHESYLHCTKRNFPYFFCAFISKCYGADFLTPDSIKITKE